MGMAGRAAPALVGTALLGGGSYYAWCEWSRELPAPCKVIARSLEDPAMHRQLGFQVAPWSMRLWHGTIDSYFARVVVPIYEVYAPMPALPWFQWARRRSEILAGLQLMPSGEWRVNSLLENPVEGVEAPEPLRTDDIIAGESGRSVRQSE